MVLLYQADNMEEQGGPGKGRQSSWRVRKRTALEETGCGLDQGLQSWDIPEPDSSAVVTTDMSCVQLARFPSSVLHRRVEISILLDFNGLHVYYYCRVTESRERGFMGVISPSQNQSFKPWLMGEEMSEKAKCWSDTHSELFYWNVLQRSSRLTHRLLEQFGFLQLLLSSRMDLSSSTLLLKKKKKKDHIWIILQSLYSLSHLAS